MNTSHSHDARAQHDDTKVFSYDPPRSLADNLWQVRGSLAMGVPRNMTVYRLRDGRLVLYSVIAMHDEGMRQLEALGTPAFMVMPHDRHQMDAPFYKRRYPSLRVLAPEPGHERNVPVDGDISELRAFGIGAYPLPGTSYHEAVLELPVPNGIALCTTELLGNASGVGGFLGFLLKLVGPPGGGFGVSRGVRWREVTDGARMRAWLAELAARDDVRMVLLGHGNPVTEDVKNQLRRASQQA
jgi:hypothetical protein